MTREATLLDHRIAFEGRVFSVHRDRVRLPDGTAATLDIVRHPGSVVLLPMTDDGQIVLIRQYRYAINRWIWELPAGRQEPDEDAKTAARRECEEETGLSPGRIELLAGFYPTPGFCDEHMQFFRLTALKKLAPGSADVHPDLDEQIEVKVVSLERARAMLQAGEIVDLKTAVGLNLLDRF